MKARTGIVALVAVLGGWAWAGGEGTNPPPNEMRLEVDLVDGSRVIGTPKIESVSVRTAYAKMDIPLKHIERVNLEDDHETASLDLRNGDKIKGALDVGAVALTTLFGHVSVGIPLVRSIQVCQGGPPSSSLVFWNKLGSEQEAFRSEVGPGLKAYEGGGWPEVSGVREFVPGRHGNAVTLRGAYQNQSRVHNLILGNVEKVLNAERGCIEAWYYQEVPPAAYSHGMYRIFDGPFGVGENTVAFFAVPESLTFAVRFGAEGQTVSLPIAELPNRKWVHVAGTWDRRGLGGSPETVRLYVDGKPVASARGENWGSSMAGNADIGGSNDQNCPGKFRLDNLKIWNCAKTDFSDRDLE